jgi:hypothetical protein
LLIVPLKIFIDQSIGDLFSTALDGIALLNPLEFLAKHRPKIGTIIDQYVPMLSSRKNRRARCRLIGEMKADSEILEADNLRMAFVDA